MSLPWKYLAIIAGLVLVFVLLATINGAGLPVGQVCIVQLRRDALGAGGDNVVPPTTNGMNGASTRVLGRLEQVTRDWVVVKVDDAGDPANGARVWIPRHNVLMIESQPPMQQ
jgi:hypothetical protein